MTTAGFPGTFPGITTTVSDRSIGAVQKINGTARGFPGTFPGITTTVGYRTIGAVQKSAGIAYTLTIGQGSFALNGQSVTFSRAVRVAIGQGSFALSGQSITFTKAISVAIGQGSFALNGQAVTLTAMTSLDRLARDLAWIKLLVEADEVHNGGASTITKLESGTATSLLVKSFTGVPLSNLTLTHVSSGDDTYAGSTSIPTLAALAAVIRAIIEADETQAASLLTKYTKATVTPILTKNVTGTPLVDLQALQ